MLTLARWLFIAASFAAVAVTQAQATEAHSGCWPGWPGCGDDEPPIGP